MEAACVEAASVEAACVEAACVETAARHVCAVITYVAQNQLLACSYHQLGQLAMPQVCIVQVSRCIHLYTRALEGASRCLQVGPLLLGAARPSHPPAACL